VCDAQALNEAVGRHEPEIIVHMAAQSLVRQSYADPIETYRSNVLGTAHLLEASRRVGSVRVVLVVTTDKCYENRQWPWRYREIDRLGGDDPYSSSKACAELITQAYRTAFLEQAGIAVASVRAGNVVGGGDWAKDRLIPDIVRSLLEGNSPRIRYPDAVRPWQFVLEPLAGYLLLTQRLWQGGSDYPGPWNFGPDSSGERAVAWAVERFLESWGVQPHWESDGGDHPHEAQVLRLDSAKAQHYLGWKPRLELSTALEWIADWYKAYVAGADMRALTMEQIAAFAQRGA